MLKKSELLSGSPMMENVWISFVTEVFFIIIILLDNVLKVCFSVNVPCVLK